MPGSCSMRWGGGKNGRRRLATKILWLSVSRPNPQDTWRMWAVDRASHWIRGRPPGGASPRILTFWHPKLALCYSLQSRSRPNRRHLLKILRDSPQCREQGERNPGKGITFERTPSIFKLYVRWVIRLFDEEGLCRQAVLSSFNTATDVTTIFTGGHRPQLECNERAPTRSSVQACLRLAKTSLISS